MAFASSSRRVYTSATATASTSGQRSASRRSSLPRPPAPIRPKRTRLLAPITRPAPAAAIDPRNSLRFDMVSLPSGAGVLPAQRLHLVDELRNARHRILVALVFGAEIASIPLRREKPPHAIEIERLPALAPDVAD